MTTKKLITVVLILFFSVFSSFSQTWKNDISGSWNSSSNWSGGGSPNSVGATATLGSVITQQRTINLTSPRTIGNLNFNSANTYWVKDSTINWNNTGSSNANINVATNQEHWLDPISNLQDNLNINVSSGSTLRMGGAFTGNKDIIKNGLGSLNFDLNGTSASTGKLIINAGTVVMERTSTNGAFTGSSILLNGGGTLLISNSNQIGNSTNLIMNGGTLTTGTTGSETLGTLTLTANSIIDFAAISNFDLYFGNSSMNLWSGTLTINDWSGNQTGGTNSRIFFSNNSSGLTSAQLAQVNFTGFGSGAILLSNGELVPNIVPETSVMWAGILLVLIFMARQFWEARKDNQ